QRIVRLCAIPHVALAQVAHDRQRVVKRRGFGVPLRSSIFGLRSFALVLHRSSALSSFFTLGMTTQSTADGITTRAWVDIDLGALLRNGEAVARLARVPILPMVKADGYGLGALPVVRTLSKLDPFGFGVATVTEGRELRAAGVSLPVMVFTPLLAAELPQARDLNLIPTLSSARAVAEWAESGGGPWHLAIATGVSRAGVRWDRIAEVADAVLRFPPAGACTHFHSPELDDGSMEIQEQRFEEAIASLPRRPAILHAASSAAIVRRAPSKWNLVRPGVFL